MKKLTAFIALLPGAAFAHGGHAPLYGPSHDSYHIAPLLGVALIVAALALAMLRGRDE